MVPITPVGKLIASVTMLCGVLVLALPINVVGGNFVEAYQIYQKKERIIKERPPSSFLSHQARAEYFEEKCMALELRIVAIKKAIASAAAVVKEVEEHLATESELLLSRANL
eukprot:c15545_g1_i1.p2 GENE.c15545_g1_i1~~c15545_g1_i1.p2  ORF type:complete len:112 (+),score=30.52 c15545_g1_i1:3-338(+)